MNVEEALRQAVEDAYEAGFTGEEIDAIVNAAISHAYMLKRDHA